MSTARGSGAGSVLREERLYPPLEERLPVWGKPCHPLQPDQDPEGAPRQSAPPLDALTKIGLSRIYGFGVLFLIWLIQLACCSPPKPVPITEAQALELAVTACNAKAKAEYGVEPFTPESGYFTATNGTWVWEGLASADGCDLVAKAYIMENGSSVHAFIRTLIPPSLKPATPRPGSPRRDSNLPPRMFPPEVMPD